MPKKCLYLYILALTKFDFKSIHSYQAAAYSVRDRLI